MGQIFRVLARLLCTKAEGHTWLGGGKPGFRNAPLPTDPSALHPIHACACLVSMPELPMLSFLLSPLTSHPDSWPWPSPPCSRKCPHPLWSALVSQGPGHSARGRVGGVEPWQPGPKGLFSWPGATLLANQAPTWGPRVSICKVRFLPVLSICRGLAITEVCSIFLCSSGTEQVSTPWDKASVEGWVQFHFIQSN